MGFSDTLGPNCRDVFFSVTENYRLQDHQTITQTDQNIAKAASYVIIAAGGAGAGLLYAAAPETGGVTAFAAPVVFAGALIASKEIEDHGAPLVHKGLNFLSAQWNQAEAHLAVAKLGRDENACAAYFTNRKEVDTSYRYRGNGIYEGITPLF